MPVEFEYKDPHLVMEDLFIKAGVQPSVVRSEREIYAPQFKHINGELIYRGSQTDFLGMTIEEWCAPEHLKKIKPHWFFADNLQSLEEDAFGGPKNRPNLTARGKLLREVGPSCYEDLMLRWGATHTTNGIRPGPKPKEKDRSPDSAAKANNPWLAANWNITAQGRVLAGLGAEKAAAIAKAAGSYIGATRPTR
ncbi:hypothetical protein JQ580_00150 [Bradyrhizobium japonicum]|uniref:hypothetical protein n=1 Tax=Bradyrhizobium japonicum TaxID=375 RepID=UPI001BA6F832|nr:hypothetical protein [Bradyrhizobium japonicum]MBR0989126.1 hypothetical protein [Bradyrhizobium japonicum]